MRKTLAMLAAAALFATGAFAHGGKSHRLMGTIEAVEEGRLVITTSADEPTAVLLTAGTRYEREGKPADRSALVEGARVSIDLSEDDTTAVRIKIGTGTGTGGGGGGHDGHR